MDEEIERVRRKRVYPPKPTRRMIVARRMNSIFEASAVVLAFAFCVWAVLQ